MELDGGLKDEVKEHFELKKMRERVLRLEAENKELKMGNSILQTQYTSQVETQSDILRTLHSNLEDNVSRIEGQENMIENLQEELRQQQQNFADEQAAKEMQWKATEREYIDKIKALEQQLETERDFDRVRLEGELRALKVKLDQTREEHDSAMSAAERRKAIDFDALRQDMERKVLNTREFLKKKTGEQLKVATKRTIVENQQKSAELSYQNRETEKIMSENNLLREENTQLKRKISIHKDLETELARRTHIYQKLIKRMDEKSKAEVSSALEEQNVAFDAFEPFGQTPSIQEESSIAMPIARDSQVDGPAGAELAQELADAQAETNRLQRQVDAVQNNFNILKNEFAQYRKDHSTLTQLQDQSTRLVISALYELKNQRECDPFPPASYDENAPTWQFAHMNPRQKEYFFRMLLERLNSSMCANCFPTGSQGSQQLSKASSLPHLASGQAHEHHGQGSQFLWSVMTDGPQRSTMSGREVVQKAVQTIEEPSTADHSHWSIQSRGRLSESSSSTMLNAGAGLRGTWGPRSLSQSSLKVKTSSLGVSGPVVRGGHGLR